MKALSEEEKCNLTCNIISNSSRFKTLLKVAKGEGRKKGVFIIFHFLIKLLQCCSTVSLHKTVIKPVQYCSNLTYNTFA